MFARVQQFAARIYRPGHRRRLVSAGWAATAITGAITRSSARKAFADHCGLPELRGQAAIRRAHSESRFRRGGADPSRRLRRLHAADARRLLRRKPALAHRCLDARPPLGAGQSAAHRAIVPAKGLHLAVAPAFRDRHYGLSRLAALDGAAARRHRACPPVNYIRPEYFTDDFALFPTWPRFDASARSICSRSPWPSCSRRRCSVI